MKSFFFPILTGHAEVSEVSARPAKGKNFQPLNDIHLTAPRNNGVDFVPIEIHVFLRTIRRSILRRTVFFSSISQLSSIFGKPLTVKLNFTSFCNFQFDKREKFL